MEVVSGDVASLVANPGMAEAVQLAIATEVGVEQRMVQVTLEAGAARRLRGTALLEGAARRRLEGVMVASYVITYPADEQGISDAKSAAGAFEAKTEAQLTSALQSAIATVPDLLGEAFTLVVQTFDAPALVIVTASPSGSTTDPLGAPSAAPGAARLGLVARLAVAAAVVAASTALA